MPDRDENIAFGSTYSIWTTAPGVNGRYFGPGATLTGPDSEFLPALGWRSFADGAHTNQGYNGVYWAASAASDTDGDNLTFHSGHVYPWLSSHQAFGAGVRCVSQNP